MKKLSQLLLLAGILVWNSSCEKSTDHDHDEEHDVVGKIVFTFTNSTNASDKKVFTWSDMDGVGGANPTIDTMKLAAESSYNVSVVVTSTANTDITSEIVELKDEHQFFYEPSASLNSNLVITILDKDSKNLPVGLSATALTKNTSSGSLNVVLSHYDGVVKTGTAKSPESDVDVTFPVLIQ